MKNRYHFFRFNGLRIERLTKRMTKSPDEGKLKLSDVIMFLSTCLLFGLNYIPESVKYHREIEILIAVGLFGIGLFLEYRRKAPRPCWTKASVATAVIAAVWGILPWILYWSEEMDIETAQNLTICSTIMWLASLGCYIRLRYIRRRSREEIAMMRMREKRRRKTEYL